MSFSTLNPNKESFERLQKTTNYDSQQTFRIPEEDEEANLMHQSEDSIIDAEEFRDQPLSVMVGGRHSIGLNIVNQARLQKSTVNELIQNQRSKTPGIPMKRRDTKMHQLISSRKTGFSHGTGGTYVRKELVMSKQDKLELERRRDLSTYGTKSKNKKIMKLAA